MKLVRYGAKGAEKPGLIDKSGQVRDLSAHVKDLDGVAYAPASLKQLAAIDPASLPAVSGKPRFGAPVTGISKFLALGLNYVDHAKKTGSAFPTGPAWYMISSMAKRIPYVSQFLTLLPGDFVISGTPPGVGPGMKPPQFLNVGEVVTLGIEGLGEKRQEIIAA